MQQKSLLILAGVTLLALVTAFLTLRGRDAVASPTTDELLFPELSARINDVAEMRIEKAGKTVTLRKSGGQWTLADRGGYPAQVEKVKELAVRIASLEIEETKTAKKANHAQLGVEWPPKPAQQPMDAEDPDFSEEPGEIEAGLVSLKDAAGKELAALVIGKSEWRGSKPKVYARRASEEQVYLCAPRGSLDAVPDAKSWIEAKFIELANDRVQNVRIEHQDGETVDIARSAENHTQFVLQGLAPGQQERYQGISNSVAQALGYGLQLDDVRPVGEVDFTQEPLASTTFRCVDGLELVLDTAKLEEKVWVKVSARYVPPPESPEDDATADETLEEEGEDEAPATAEDAGEQKDVPKEVAELNARLSPWAFEIPSYKTDVLTRHRKDLLAEPTPTPTLDDGGLQGLLDSMGIDAEETEPAIEAGPDPDDEGSSIPAPEPFPEPVPEDGEAPPGTEPPPTEPK